MKKILIVILLGCALAGCRAPQSYETMTDLFYAPTLPAPREIEVWLPENTDTMEHEDGSILYLCDGYSVALQTMASGDMDATLSAVTGYHADALRGLRWEKDGLQCYACAWASIGESGDQVARTVVLDDGVYHYAVTVMGPAELAADLADTWQTITDSVGLDAGP